MAKLVKEEELKQSVCEIPIDANCKKVVVKKLSADATEEERKEAEAQKARIVEIVKIYFREPYGKDFIATRQGLFEFDEAGKIKVQRDASVLYMVSCITKWEGITDDKGNIAEINYDNAVRLPGDILGEAVKYFDKMSSVTESEKKN